MSISDGIKRNELAFKKSISTNSIFSSLAYRCSILAISLTVHIK